MKTIQFIISIVFVFGLLLSCNKSESTELSYHFDKNGISREVLENYLEKSITMVYFVTPDNSRGRYPYYEDDVRMIKNIGAKFIGRAIYRWGGESKLADPNYLKDAEKIIQEMHEYDPDMVFQACLFEIVTPEVNQIPIPEWVFRGFGKGFEERNFSYEAMLNPEGKFVNHWRENSSVPDISQLETQMWFYFLAGSYINIGVEAFHIGQVELMGMNDPDRDHWADIIAKMRDYARRYGRRNWVIIDAHTPYFGMVKDGVSLLDFNSFPMRIKEIPEEPYKGKLEVNYLDALYQKSKGCITPSGWECESLPYLIEFDNFGKGPEGDVANVNSIFVWGWDEITWLSQQPEEYRNEFIQYVYHWIKDTDPNGFLQMPGHRMITHPNSIETAGSYRANTHSAACPIGYSQEETIKAIWGTSDKNKSKPKKTKRTESENVRKAKLVLLSMLRHTWEQGTAANAFIESGDDEIAILMASESVYRQHCDGRLGLVQGAVNITDPAVNGESVMFAYKMTGNEKYKKAAEKMLDYLKTAPQTNEGIHFHNTQGNLIAADCMYMIPTFYAVMGEYDEAVRQVDLRFNLLWNEDAGAMNHMWDGVRNEWIREKRWATASGWNAAAIVKVLHWLPDNMKEERERLNGYLNKLVAGVMKYQRPDGLFHDILDDPTTFVESCSSAMMAYTIYRGVDWGYLDKSYIPLADKIRKTLNEKIDKEGFLQGAASAPQFTESGVSPEGQAFFILMETAAKELK
jgi:rhamnogalacturonyl hydrolase YesR